MKSAKFIIDSLLVGWWRTLNTNGILERL